ncbi:MAG TPA: ATP-binding protein, partial [Bacteroidota bacterium]|nr:ATP-binding protein [Bacteroidota bacterium]
MISARHTLQKRLRRQNNNQIVISAEELIKSLNLIIGLDQLLENFSAKLREMLDAVTVHIVLYEPITNRYVGKMTKGKNIDWLEKFNFSRSDNLIKWLNVNRCALDVTPNNEVVRFLSEQEQEILHTTNTVLIVPLIVLNRLTGAIFLSGRTNGIAYAPTDIDMLTMLANQSALAIEHALMYQFQEDRLKKIFHADKLITVGELAAGAAHEIRNPLTSIRSTIQYLQKDLPDEKKLLVDGIIEEVDRIDQVIQGLLSFSKTNVLNMTVVDVQEVLNQTLLLLDSELRHHSIDTQKNYTSPNMQIVGDTPSLKQLFLNILLNSIQAMPNGGTITITISDTIVSDRIDHGKDVLCIEISDTGAGIPEQHLPKVFDPFFTTKESGTGLGLSI